MIVAHSDPLMYHPFRLVEGTWVDQSIKDPLTKIFVLLTESRDRSMIQQWTTWLVKRDPIRALKVRIVHYLHRANMDFTLSTTAPDFFSFWQAEGRRGARASQRYSEL